MKISVAMACFWAATVSLAVAQAIQGVHPITPAGEKLRLFLDGQHVEEKWSPSARIDWYTGESIRPSLRPTSHCSAFVASVCKQAGVYILRPPEHAQVLLANAQHEWLLREGASRGWRQVHGAVEAQSLANEGMLVVASFENPDPGKPGHIAVIRPSDKAATAIERDGPEETQAGKNNFVDTTIENGFRHHPGAWSGRKIAFFAHAIDWP